MKRADILIDALGKVDEKYIERSAPLAGGKRNINPDEMTDGLVMSETSSGLVEITVPKPTPKEKRNRRIKIAAMSGLAAAIAITAGVIVWNRLGGFKAPFSDNGVDITMSPDVDPEKIIEEANWFPDIRDLKWGMTLDEVKAHETEKLIREEVLTPAGIEQTLLEYENVRYKDYFTTMVLCVEKEAGFSGVNYYVDKSQYPDAWDELLTALCDEYGGEPKGKLMAQWGIKQKNLMVMLYNHDTTVQVGFYPYFDPPEIPEDPSEDTTSSDYVGDWSDISTWKQYGEELEPVLPVYLPNMPDFDEESFDPYEDGYPRVMLKCIQNADPDGKTDIYLLAERVFADIDDRNILYGDLSVGIAEHGSETLNGMQNISAVYEGYLEKINVNDLDKYLQIFHIDDGNGEPRTLIKYAYGESEPYYYTTFASVNAGQAELAPFGNLSGYTQTTDSGSPVVGMPLSGELEQNGNEILDNVNGLAFSFDFAQCEISIRTFAPTVQPENTQPSTVEKDEDDGTIKLKTFDIPNRSYCSHERNPGETVAFDLDGGGGIDAVLEGSTAYYNVVHWLDADKLLAQAKDALGDDYASFEAAVMPYCNADGSLNYEKASAIPKVQMGGLFEDLHYYSEAFYSTRVLNDKWLIDFNEEDVGIGMSNDFLTNIRKAAVYLWSVYDEYPDMTVTAVSDYDKKECYLLVVSEDCPMIQAAMQKDCGNDAAACCRFMTSFDAKADWLPVTMLRESGSETYLRSVEQLDMYNIAFDSGIYSGTQWGGRNDIIEQLRELVKLKEAKILEEETGNMPRSVKNREEFTAALRENLKSFERVIPYASIFDPIKLPTSGFRQYYSLGDVVLEVSASRSNTNNEEYEVFYRLLTPASDEYSGISRYFRYNVAYFRDHYKLDDPANGYSGYTIRGIEVIDVGGSMKIRLIADESMWEEIRRFNEEGILLGSGDLMFASEPTDTGRLEAWEN